MEIHSMPLAGYLSSSERDGAEAAGEPDSERGRDLRNGSLVLIVEDDFLIAMEAETALSDAGLDVVGIATTAEEALSLAREHRPALALMDIRLAGQRDGVDAAGDLFRELGIRCVFASAHDDPQTRERAAALAPLGWLTKPYTMASLISLVQQALSNPGTNS